MVSLTCTALLDIQKMAFEKERRELLEAAEFEQRVIVKLAGEGYRTFMPCLDTADCPFWGHNPSCPWCRIKAARLAVEEEMNADIQAKDKAIQDFR